MQEAAAGAQPREFVEINGTLFFSARGDGLGAELWKSDGTSEGTELVKDINPGPAGSDPSELTRIGNTLYFRAEQPGSGAELWKSDGTPEGTMLVDDIRAGEQDAFPRELTAVGSTLFFSADDGATGRELWQSDGTEQGTVQVRDINPGAGHSAPLGLTNVNGTLYFAAAAGFLGRELWKSDGTESGTVQVKDIAPSGSSSPQDLVAVGPTLFFSADDGTNGRELWKSDGSEAGTVLVRDIDPGGDGAKLAELTNVNGTLFFAASDGQDGVVGPDGGTGLELWKSDGTTAGTVLVKDIAPFSSSLPRELTNVNGTLFFKANNTELWKSDGTAAGTTLVKAFSGFPAIGELVAFNDVLMLGAEGDSSEGLELWISDGTPGGTTLVADINPGGLDSEPLSFAATSLGLFFSAEDGSNGRELWVSDGSGAGTQFVASVRDGDGDSLPRDFVNAGGTVFFTAFDNAHGSELWKTDGTPAGTSMVRDIRPGSAGSQITDATALGNSLIFDAFDGASSNQLWISDGSESGTSVLADVRPYRDGEQVFEKVGNLLFFAADLGRELWKTDGTASGTSLVLDVPLANPTNRQLTNVDGTLYFVTDDNGDDFLWRSDGTETGTVEVGPVNDPEGLTAAGGLLFFSANNNFGDRELYASDGTTISRVKGINDGGDSDPEELTEAGGALFFTADDGVHGRELWTSDGTEAGTVLVKDIFPGGGGSGATGLVNVAGTLFFAANDGTRGLELWRSDGTAPGTQLVADIAEDSAPSVPQALAAVGEFVLFAAANDDDGLELWVSDGSTGGTQQVQDIRPGAASSAPEGFTRVGDFLVFAANDGATGVEPWAVTVDELFRFDFGDAPSPYPTLLEDDGARHAPEGVMLGASRDIEPDGQPDVAAAGDDNDATGDDEDGVTFDTDLVAGSTATITVTASGAAMLSAWVDFNADGDWDDANERIFSGEAVGAGANSLTFPVPDEANIGTSFGRFRLSSSGVSGTTGAVNNGEVEDYQVTIAADDDGDGVPNGEDNCPDTANPDQIDTDGNGQGDACDPDDDGDGLSDDYENANGLDPLDPADAQGDPDADGYTNLQEADNGTDPNDFADRPLDIPGQITKLLADDGIEASRFAVSLAISGDTVLVGAVGEGGGAAYVFIRAGGNWSLQAKLTASDAANNDGFGAAVDLIGDIAVVGAPGDDDAGFSSGSAYIFVRDGDSWSQQAKLTASDAAQDDNFGTAVAIDDDIALIGALRNQDAGFGTGSAYVFARENGVWGQQAKLLASDATSGSAFGNAVALDAGTALIGAFGDEEARGAAYVFTENSGTWSEQAKLIGADSRSSSGFGDQLGIAVALDGDTAVIGANYDSDGPLFRAGSAYIFTRADGTWTQQAKLLPDTPASEDFFGRTVAIDGNTVLLGAPGRDAVGSQSGISYLFTRNDQGDWVQQMELLPDDGAAGDLFGRSLALEQGIAVVGSFLDDNARGTNAGAGYIFGLNAVDRLRLDFGDAPAHYAASPTDGAASHVPIGPLLGSARDTEFQRQSQASAFGDDNDAEGDDEDGVSFGAGLEAGANATFTVTASAAAKLDAWIDFNADGDWNDDGEQVFSSEALNAGNNVYSVAVPADAAHGSTFARFRLSSSGGLSTTGRADDGEVEDHQVGITADDTDGDGMPDGYETANGLDPKDPDDAGNDPDNDGLTNLEEYNAGTDPQDPDTDADGIGDAFDNTPDTPSNACTGADAQFANALVRSGTTTQCAADTAIRVEDTVIIESGGRVELFSPTVAFEIGFSVPEGAELRTLKGDPAPP
jgi:ELWxxDGT repeat protein